jgi:iron complex outermembrane recepter protein
MKKILFNYCDLIKLRLYFTNTIFFVLLFCFKNNAQTKFDSLKINDLSEVVVNATRANDKTGMAYTNVLQKDLKKQNLGQDLPFLLNQLPSVVVSSDAGTGIGYTGIRIRGTDPTRINVTLNGIPYNDSESQGVYWVNMPDFASSVQSIQVQRGVGTSTNGAGAFGGSINVNTLTLSKEAFGEANSTIGSFATFKTNLLLSSGLLNDRFVIDARLSNIKSDGYVDRATANLRSFYVSGGYYHQNSFVRFNVFSGHEKTYQSWNGIPEALAKGDDKGIDAFIERNYYDEDFKKSMLSSGRKFNFYNYENEVDDYTQTHYQLISSFQTNKHWRFNPTLHYTKGMGFYEQFKADQKFSNYGLTNVKIDNAEIKRTDLVRRKWLNNDFYGAVWSFDYDNLTKIKANIGGGINKYDGGHFGEIIWAKYASESKIRQRYYDNQTTKTDFNIYGKVYYNFNEKFDAYLDIQSRSVSFKMNGTADALQKLEYRKTYNFINPKLGFTYQISNETTAYWSYAVGNKEPSRQDFVDNEPKVPTAENLNDFEGGYRMSNRNFKIDINAYYMIYKNQLVLTGQVNGVGEAIRTNVAKSSRKGIELQIAGNFSEKFKNAFNLTLSNNSVNDFEETIVSYDDTPEKKNKFSKTDISFSPKLIAGNSLIFLPIKNLEISILSKYVSKQYLDNTQSESKKLDAFFVNDMRFSYTIKTEYVKEINFSLLVNNVFNHQYESNGYTYSYISGSVITENFMFPQAGINILAAIKLRF